MNTVSAQELLQKIIGDIMNGKIVFLEQSSRDEIERALISRGYSQEELVRWWNAFYTYWIAEVSITLEGMMDQKKKNELIALYETKGEKDFLSYSRIHHVIPIDVKILQKLYSDVGIDTLKYFLDKSLSVV